MGSTIDLFRDKILNLTVTVYLKERYVHSLQIQSYFGNFFINSTGFTIPNGFFYHWESDLTFFALEQKNYIAEYKKDALNIILKHDIKSHTIFIKRISDPLEYPIPFFDIYFPNLGTDYNKIDGLIGKVGKNKFSFHNPVQSGTHGIKEAKITVDGSIKKSTIKTKGEKECWFIDVQDALEKFFIELRY